MKSIRNYEIVLEIYRQGSISRAAEVMQISQPTLSKLLHKLEDELQIELFDRTCNPIQLTNAGKEYVKAGTRILDIDRQLDKKIEKIRNKTSDDICIGISPSRAPYILPQYISCYRKFCPEGRIAIKEGNTTQLKGMLMRGEVDMIISILDDSTKTFRYTPLFKETIMLAVPERMKDMTPNEIIKNGPIITMPMGMHLRDTLALIIENTDEFIPRIECQSIHSGLPLVKSGHGAMLVPSYVINTEKPYDKIINFIRLPERFYKEYPHEFERDVCLFYRNKQFLSSSDLFFIKACKEMSKVK